MQVIASPLLMLITKIPCFSCHSSLIFVKLDYISLACVFLTISSLFYFILCSINVSTYLSILLLPVPLDFFFLSAQSTCLIAFAFLLYYFVSFLCFWCLIYVFTYPVRKNHLSRHFKSLRELIDNLCIPDSIILLSCVAVRYIYAFVDVVTFWYCTLSTSFNEILLLCMVNFWLVEAMINQRLHP